MNAFVFNLKDKRNSNVFLGSLNEDTTAYTYYGRKGLLFLSTPPIIIHQKETQTQSGGLTEIYKKLGTYVKSFYSVVATPSAVKVGVINCPGGGQRIHHSIRWNNCVPKIISPDFCKT